MQINAKLQQFMTKHKQIKVAAGGRGSGKSIGFGDILTMKMETENADIYCLREYQDSVADSVHRVFKGSIERHNLRGWKILENKVIAPCGAQTIYKGAARNPDSIQSAQGYKYSWFEEAHRASKASLDKLLPTIIRNPGAECWFSANPQSSNDPFSQRFITPYLSDLKKHGFYEDELHLIVIVNWRDNPWWNDEQEVLRLWDYENRPRAEYDWIWEGHFNDSVEDSIIKSEWFDAAVDSHVKLGFKPRGQRVVTHDPSDSGDAKALADRWGSVVMDVQQNTHHDVNEGCDWATSYAINNNADVFRWDCDGIGLSLKKQVSDSLNGKRIKAQIFKGSRSPENENEIYQKIEGSQNNIKNIHAFKNMRAQCAAYLRDRFYNTYRAVEKKEYIDPDKLISISSDIKEIVSLRSEVCRIPEKKNGSGLFQVMSKVEMKKLKIESPNMFDCLMMSMADAPKKNIDFHKKLEIKTRGIV